MLGKQHWLTDEIREAVANCGESRYRISVNTGLSEATLSRFMSGTRGLSMDSLDALCAYLGLHICSEQRKKRK